MPKPNSMYIIDGPFFVWVPSKRDGKPSFLSFVPWALAHCTKERKEAKERKCGLGCGGFRSLLPCISGRLPRLVSVRLGGTIAARAVDLIGFCITFAWPLTLVGVGGGVALFWAALCGWLLWCPPWSAEVIGGCTPHVSKRCF